MSISLNLTDFYKKFNRITKKAIPEVVEKGLGKAGLQLLADSILQRPTAPIKEGWLRGSGSVFVNNKCIGESPSGRKGKANKNHNESIKPREMVGVVGFNVPYAARLHEGEQLKFREPSSGPKFLESKMARNKNVYFKIIANVIKGGR